jgi:hypothetical protein
MTYGQQPRQNSLPEWWEIELRKAQQTSKKNMFYTNASTPSLEGSGCWVINQSFRIYVKKKPNWLHKKMVKLMFGWGWESKE